MCHEYNTIRIAKKRSFCVQWLFGGIVSINVVPVGLALTDSVEGP